MDKARSSLDSLVEQYPNSEWALESQFRRGEMVSCVDENGKEIARGLVNYDADEAREIAGISSKRITEVLGYISDEEMIHRDNLVVV